MRQPYENKALPRCSEATRDALERARRLVDPDCIRDFEAEDGARRREQAQAEAGRLSSMIQRKQGKGRTARKSTGDDASA